MYVMALALVNEMKRFPGGPKALAASLQVGIEALRPMRWPAERLDTLGGYLTYHNITLFTFFLAIYGALQGARAIRGDEDKHKLEEILATGWSRTAVIRDRAIGFLIVMAIISLGLGLGTAASLVAGDQPDLGGSLITFMGSGLCAMVGYSLGLVVSQLTASSTVAAGISSLMLTIVYVATNMWENVIGFISPFHYSNQLRALVPGYGFNVWATFSLVLMSAILLALAAKIFVLRDYRSPLWVRRSKVTQAQAKQTRVQRPILNSIWTSFLLRNRIGLIAWIASTAAFAALMGVLQPSVMDAWKSFDFIGAIAGGGASDSAENLYVSFAGDMLTPVIAAYVITQAAKWVADLAQGRVEATLAAPISWTRLIRERLQALIFGLAVITVGGVAGLILGLAGVGARLSATGVLRLTIGSILIGAALAAIGAIVVAAFRSSIAVTLLAVFVGASYLLGLIVPLFNWPNWINRLSIFYTMGHLYVAWPSLVNTVIVVGIAVLGTALAASIAERTPKVA
ncbi:ABC-2 family transporter protein [mine drainage metagenome]|uniref:ABC-2 family transporter protein n=1 Tax=mine drainage metagenome TaxID=410659 RepID=A0A1J5QDM2_9ZZZZ